MNLSLNDDQRMIRESADAVLADIAGSAQTRAAMETSAGFDAAVWQHLAQELGWCAIPVPESQGGLGLGAVELVQLFEPMGRQLLCAPYFSTVALAASVLIQVGTAAAQAEWLPAIAEGRLRATAMAPVDAGDDWIGSTAALRAERNGEGWQLSGALDRLLDGATAELLLLAAPVGAGQTGWFAVVAGAEGLRAQALQGWDRSRRFANIELDAVSARRIEAPKRLWNGLPRIAALARLCLAAEQLGGAQACLDLTVAYTATRKQFGRTIAGFQAVKHRCAEMMVDIEALRSAVYGAAAVFDDAASGGDYAREATMALAQAKDSYFRCAQEAIQLHGGVGFTWEYDPQLHFKRAQAGSHWLGTAAALRARIADAVMA
jgi:alkylation response protein AidB-like acyl-CoA dehydrogenase